MPTPSSASSRYLTPGSALDDAVTSDALERAGVLASRILASEAKSTAAEVVEGEKALWAARTALQSEEETLAAITKQLALAQSELRAAESRTSDARNALRLTSARRDSAVDEARRLSTELANAESASRSSEDARTVLSARLETVHGERATVQREAADLSHALHLAKDEQDAARALQSYLSALALREGVAVPATPAVNVTRGAFASRREAVANSVRAASAAGPHFDVDSVHHPAFKATLGGKFEGKLSSMVYTPGAKPPPRRTPKWAPPSDAGVPKWVPKRALQRDHVVTPRPRERWSVP
jgi:hypothetical protein